METFSEFVERHWDELYRLAHLLAGQDSTADDVLQSALTKAWRSWARIESAQSPTAYVKRILTTTAIDDHRSRDRQTRLRQAESQRRSSDSTSWESATIDRHDLWPLIAALPPRQRAIVVLRYYEDMPEREIARVLGCRPGTVKSQASTALDRLQTALTGNIAEASE